jgi:hypothetical protein
MDTLSKSDPFCVLSMHSNSAPGAAGNWVELGRTEVIMNNLSPQWQKSFALDYYFESVQWLRFDVYDGVALHCIALHCIALVWFGLVWFGLDWICRHCVFEEGQRR